LILISTVKKDFMKLKITDLDLDLESNKKEQKTNDVGWK